jgi:hypothetical protein
LSAGGLIAETLLELDQGAGKVVIDPPRADYIRDLFLS